MYGKVYPSGSLRGEAGRRDVDEGEQWLFDARTSCYGATVLRVDGQTPPLAFAKQTTFSQNSRSGRDRRDSSLSSTIKALSAAMNLLISTVLKIHF